MRLRTCLLLVALGVPLPIESTAAGRDFARPPHSARSGGFCPKSIRWQAAENYVGQRRNVRGPVKSTFYARRSSGRPTFLDMGRRFPNRNRFTVVIWGRNRPRFPRPPEHLYRREYLCVSGRIRLFEGLPQTFVKGPGDIDIRGDR
jgi:hypothetical protein